MHDIHQTLKHVLRWLCDFMHGQRHLSSTVAWGLSSFFLHATQHDAKQGTWDTLFNISTYKPSHKPNFTAMLAKLSAIHINCHFSSSNCESLFARDY